MGNYLTIVTMSGLDSIAILYVDWSQYAQSPLHLGHSLVDCGGTHLPSGPSGCSRLGPQQLPPPPHRPFFNMFLPLLPAFRTVYPGPSMRPSCCGYGMLLFDAHA